jgi:hypothetical protein
VIVHGLAHARAALAPALPVTLLSAPGAAIYAGAGWWLALMAQAAAPYAPPPHILDCGSAPGRALEAVRAGQKRLILRAPVAILSEVSILAAAEGAIVLAVPPASLDLAQPGASRGLTAWLEQSLSEHFG